MAKQELPFPALKSVQKWYDGLDNSQRPQINKRLNLLSDMTILEKLAIGAELPKTLKRLPKNPRTYRGIDASKEPQLYSIDLPNNTDVLYFAIHDGKALLLSKEQRGTTHSQEHIENAQRAYLYHITPPKRMDEAEEVPPSPTVKTKLWGTNVRVPRAENHEIIR